MRSLWTSLLAFFTCVILSSCACSQCGDRVAANAGRAEIVSTLERYQVALRSVSAAAMAAFYTPTAMLLEPGIAPVYSRDAIRAFIASFPGVRVDIATATPDEIQVFGDTAYLWGSYFERLAFPGQPVSEQHGKFVTEWSRQSDGTWLIARFLRVPVPDPSPKAASPAP
ncbi:MAG: YybH family protein [Planctomycetota bacterium]